MTNEVSSAAKSNSVKLVASRPMPKTGMPTDGLMILVGQPKSGKTTFAASFPDSYVLELDEGGGDRVDGRIHSLDSLNSFRETVKAVAQEPSIKTIVIDTIDVLSDWFEDEIAKARGLSTISERKPGVDGFELWADYRKRIEGLSNFLIGTKKLIILVAHCKEPKVDGNGTLVSPAGINIPGKSGGYLAAKAEMIGYTFKKPMGSGTVYFVTFQGGPLGLWGSRVKELNDKTIQLNEKNPYKGFEDVFTTKKEIKTGGKKK